MSEITGLKYLGENGHPYMILSVPIPARDLNRYDLERLAYQMGCTTNEVIIQLTTPPGKSTRVLYEADTNYFCGECGKEYKTWNGYNKHMLDHAESLPIEEVTTEDEESI